MSRAAVLFGRALAGRRAGRFLLRLSRQGDPGRQHGASQCGYTPQLKGLETLYQTYRARGLVVLGFPSGDFNQEHDNPADTARVAIGDYGVTFPLFASSAVSGARANGFFKALEQASGKAPQWNFQKYLIDRKGKVVTVFPAQVAPDDLLLRGAIEAALAE